MKWSVLRACAAERDGTEEMAFALKRKKRNKCRNKVVVKNTALFEVHGY